MTPTGSNPNPVSELSGTLDDSVPSCKPAPTRPAPGRGTVGYTKSVALTGPSGRERAVAKADTGADRTSVDVELASAIGSGPITGHATVRSAAGDRSVTRPLVDVHVAIGDAWERVTVNVEDWSHMNHPVILGRDVLSGYRVDIGRHASDVEGSTLEAATGSTAEE